MQTKNIYKMGIAFSLLFSIFPLLGLIVANILAKFNDCGVITQAVAPNCALGEVIYSLFVLSWLTIVTFPLGVAFALMFYLLYLSVRRR